MHPPHPSVHASAHPMRPHPALRRLSRAAVCPLAFVCVCMPIPRRFAHLLPGTGTGTALTRITRHALSCCLIIAAQAGVTSRVAYSSTTPTYASPYAHARPQASLAAHITDRLPALRLAYYTDRARAAAYPPTGTGMRNTHAPTYKCIQREREREIETYTHNACTSSF